MEFVADYWPLWTAGMVVFYLAALALHWKRMKSGQVFDALLAGANEGFGKLEDLKTGTPGQALSTLTGATVKTAAKAFWPVLLNLVVGIAFSVMLGLSVLFNILLFLKR